MRAAMMRGVGLASFAAFAFALGTRALLSPFTAIVLAAIPLVGLALYVPPYFLMAAVAVLPFSIDLTGGRLGGVQVAASDLLLALGFFGVLTHMLTSRELRGWRPPLQPLLIAIWAYLGALVLAVAASPSLQGAFTIVQRVELVVVTLFVGAYLVRSASLSRAMALYVFFACVLAVSATVTVIVQGTGTDGFLGVQKNPAGQAIAGALLVVVSARRVPARAVLAALLAVGLLASLSRGAMLAAAVGMLVVAVLQPPERRLRMSGLVAALSAVVAVAYRALPAEQQDRLVEVSPDRDYATGERVRYADDAWATFESAPFLGVGPGNYTGGERAPGIADPHNVLLLEAAEGGIVLAGAFILLALAPLVVLVRRRHRHPLVVTAIAVQLATVLHGLVDVYWVRGTPVLGWVLVGAALALTHEDSAASKDGREEEKRWQRI